MASRITGNRTNPVVAERAPSEQAKPAEATEKKPAAGWKPAGRDSVPLSQHGSTFVVGGRTNEVRTVTHGLSTRVWNGVFTQLRPKQVAPDAAKFGGIIDGGKAVFDIEKGSDENFLRLEATGTRGKASAIIRASNTGDEAKNELWITFSPKSASSLQQLEVVTTNGEPLRFMIGGHKVERGAVMDYVEAHGTLGLGDSPNARAIMGAMFKIPDASPLIYRAGTDIVRGILLD